MSYYQPGDEQNWKKDDSNSAGRNSAEPKRRRWVWPVIAVLALFLGIGLGSIPTDTDAATATASPTQLPTPTVTETKTAPAKPAETKTVEVEKTPESCKRALDLADQGFTLAGKALGHAADAMDAITDFDLDKIEKASEGMTEVNKKVGTLKPRYQAARDACKNG